MPVTITKKKAQPNLERELAYIDAHEVRVGVLTGGALKGNQSDGASKHTGSTLTVADVFSFHELGRGNNPKRSSIVWVMDNKQGEIAALSQKCMDAVIDGKMSGEQALGLIGEKILSLAKRRIQSRIPPKLSASRLRQKRRAGKAGQTPLIHTGQMINSLRWNIIGALR